MMSPLCHILGESLTTCHIHGRRMRAVFIQEIDYDDRKGGGRKEGRKESMPLVFPFKLLRTELRTKTRGRSSPGENISHWE